MIVGSLSAKARLSDSIKALERLLYPNSAPKQRIIGRYTLRPLKYSENKSAYADGFKGKDKLARGSFEASASLNLIKVLGLGETGRYRKALINC